MRRISCMLILVLVVLAVSVVCAEEVDVTMQPAQPSTSTQPVAAMGVNYAPLTTGTSVILPVQRVTRTDGLRPCDWPVINAYLAKYCRDLSPENYACLAEALPVLIGNYDIDARVYDPASPDHKGSVILGEVPKHYLTMRQNYGAVVTGTNWYTHLYLPAFTRATDQGLLPLGTCVGGTTVATSSGISSSRFSTRGSTQESQVAFVEHSTGRISQREHHDRQHPCNTDNGQHTNDQGPTGSNLGDF